MHANAVELKGEKAQSSAQEPKLITTSASLGLLEAKLNCESNLEQDY